MFLCMQVEEEVETPHRPALELVVLVDRLEVLVIIMHL